MNEELYTNEEMIEPAEETVAVTTTRDTEEDSVKNAGVPVRQQLILVASLLLLIFGTAVVPKTIALLKKPDQQPVVKIEPKETPVKIIEANNKTFSDINLVGEAAFVWDVNAGKALYQKNETEKLPLASVTKLMTALLANEIMTSQASVVVNTAALSQSGDSGLLRDEVFDRQHLTDLTLMSSSNDGAFALAMAAGEKLRSGDGANAFVQAMNVRAKELGLSDTTYYNPTGLDVSAEQAGAYGTAKDMATLMQYIVEHNPDILTYTTEDSAHIYDKLGNYHQASNTNYYVDQIPGIIGSKTGYTDLAGGNLVVAYDAGLNHPVVVAVLGSTQNDRFTDVMQLIEASNNYLSDQEN